MREDPGEGGQGLDHEDGDPDPEAQSIRIQGTGLPRRDAHLHLTWYSAHQAPHTITELAGATTRVSPRLDEETEAQRDSVTLWAHSNGHTHS